MNTLLKNGTIVTGSGSFVSSLLIQGEKIVAAGDLHTLAPLITEDTLQLDLEGCLLFPGFIDAHTHFDLHVAGTVTADDFSSGTRAAICGGTTTIIDFATQYRGETLAQALENWHEKARGKCACDYGFHMSISDWNKDVEKEMEDMMTAGISSFKLYMTYDIQVNDKTLYEILRKLKDIRGLVGVHCENDGLIAALQEEAAEKNDMGVFSHALTRPDSAEAEAIHRLLSLAGAAGLPVVIVHLSSRAGLNVIRQARLRGQKVFVETCPQYLLLDDTRYQLPDFEGAKYVCAPPLRKPEDRDALWEALSAGDIQTLATDHCSFTTQQKALGKDDFRKIPGGLPGVETRGLLLYTYGVCQGRISLEDMCRLLSENPAKLYGLYPRKGSLLPGSDADIVVLRPGEKQVIHAANLKHHVDYSPFEDFQSAGTIDRVFLRGTQVVCQGTLTREDTGQFLKREASHLF